MHTPNIQVLCTLKDIRTESQQFLFEDIKLCIGYSKVKSGLARDLRLDLVYKPGII